MPEIRNLLWVDLETTGSEEHTDPILEVAWIITTPTLQQLLQRSVVVEPMFWRQTRQESQSAWNSDPTAWPEVVQEMHTVNGLIGEIDAGAGRPLRDVELEVIRTLELYGKKHDFMLAGSGVSHFDRRFIKTQMPDLEKWLQYPNMDVGVLRRAWQLWSPDQHIYPSGNESKTHRALDDIRTHLREADFWQGFIQGALHNAQETSLSLERSEYTYEPITPATMGHALHCESKVGRPCDCTAKDQTLYRRSPR